jgi:hypothetical protein
MPRKKQIVSPAQQTTYERKMAEAIAEYKVWMQSKKKVSVKAILDHTLPVSGSR